MKDEYSRYFLCENVRVVKNDAQYALTEDGFLLFVSLALLHA